MKTVATTISMAARGLARAIRWSLATVEDAPAPRFVPHPGPAHGPVYSIDVRLGRDRRV